MSQGDSERRMKNSSLMLLSVIASFHIFPVLTLNFHWYIYYCVDPSNSPVNYPVKIRTQLKTKTSNRN